MKKKKLKKKIKKLERDIKRIAGFQRELALKESNNTNHIKSCKDSITKLENDNKYYMADINNKPKDNRINILWEWMQRSGINFHDWGKTPTYAEEVVYTEDIQRQINEINNRLIVLEMRTRTDYTKLVDTSKGPDSEVSNAN